MLTIVSEHIKVYFRPGKRETEVAAPKSVKKLLTATPFILEKMPWASCFFVHKTRSCSGF
jgi:hypothetical protein